jgi:hypothetical protein
MAKEQLDKKIAEIREKEHGTKPQTPTPARYDRWRGKGCPCGQTTCEYYEPGDQEAQCCYGEYGDGHPMVECCPRYIPDPVIVEAWAKSEVDA